MTALKADSSLCLTPSATGCSTPSPGFKPRTSFPSLPPLPSTYSPVQPREEGMGWEPRGSAASTGIHQFCQVWLWPRPKHTTGMAQDVGAGR